MEIELKLLVANDDVEKLNDLLLLNSVTKGPVAVQHLRNVYFDTPDFDLWNAKASLRLRHDGVRCIQTLKVGDGVTAGLHQREELETDVSGESPNIQALREGMAANSPYANIITSIKLAERLQPIFSSDITRTVRRLHLRTGD